MKATACALMLIVFGGWIIGCRSDAIIEGRSDPYVPAQVMLTDKKLQRATRISPPVLSRGEGSNILYVQVPIRNVTGKQFAVDYRIRFFDANGQQLSETGWAHKYLAPKVHEQITANSYDARAADFQMDLRYAR